MEKEPLPDSGFNDGHQENGHTDEDGVKSKETSGWKGSGVVSLGTQQQVGGLLSKLASRQSGDKVVVYGTELDVQAAVQGI